MWAGIQKMFIDAALTALVCVVATNAWGGLQEGIDAYLRNEFTLASDEFRPLAEGGDAKAQFLIGMLNCCTKDKKADHGVAAEWFRKSAEQGYAPAQVQLGVGYLVAPRGSGIRKDSKKAVELFQKAAEQGNPNAQYELGALYFDGQGVARNYFKAAEFYLLAAHQGHTGAQTATGIMYHQGLGVNRDYVLALQWFMIAAITTKSQKAISLMKAVEAKITAEQKEEAKSTVAKWLTDHQELIDALPNPDTNPMEYTLRMLVKPALSINSQ